MQKSLCNFLYKCNLLEKWIPEGETGEKKKRETSLPENVIFGDAMIFVTKCYVSHGNVILYIIYVLYIIYNIT